MDEKRRQPAIIVAILALLGAASLPQVLRNQGGGTSPQAQEQADTATPQAATPPAGEEKDPDRRDLSPSWTTWRMAMRRRTPRTRTWEAISTTG